MHKRGSKSVNRTTPNPYGNAYYLEEKVLEFEGGWTRNPDTERFWKFVSATETNATGPPTGYKLCPEHSVRSFVRADSPSGRRMPFVNNHLRVTRYDPEEHYPGGEY